MYNVLNRRIIELLKQYQICLTCFVSVSFHISWLQAFENPATAQEVSALRPRYGP